MEVGVVEQRRWSTRLAVAVPLAIIVEVVARARSMTTWGPRAAVVLTVAMLFGVGWPFLVGAWRQALVARADVNVFVALGGLSTFGYSIYELFARQSVHAQHSGSSGYTHFDAAALIVTSGAAGRWLEERAAATRFHGRRMTVVVAWAVPAVLLLGISSITLFRRASDPTITRQITLDSGRTLTVEIDGLHAGPSPMHLYVMDTGGHLVAMRDLLVTALLVQDASLSRVETTARLDRAGQGHYSGSIALTAGYWLVEIDGTGDDGRVVQAGFNVEVH